MNSKVKSNVIAFASCFRVVFSRPWYIVLALAVAFLLLLLAIWLPNISFLKHVVVSESYSFANKVSIFWSYFGFWGTNFTPLTRAFILIVAILSGSNVALLVYYLKHRIKLERSAGIGILGVFTGLLGIGCASCGSVLLASFIGLSAAAAFTGFLPLMGIEFSIIGVLILLISIYLVAKKIQNPLVCKIK